MRHHAPAGHRFRPQQRQRSLDCTQGEELGQQTVQHVQDEPVDALAPLPEQQRPGAFDNAYIDAQRVCGIAAAAMRCEHGGGGGGGQEQRSDP